jgi:hypothetical protein
LTTPTGRPPRDRSRERPPRRRQVTSPAVPRDRRLSTEGPPIQRVTIPCAGRSDVTSGPPASNPKGPRSWRYLELHATSRCRLPWLTCCCVTKQPDCQRARGGRRKGSLPAPPARRPPEAGQDTPNGRRRAGRRPGGAVVPLGRRPRPAPGGARRGQGQVNRPTPTPPQGGRRVGRVAVETDRSWSSRASEPTRGAGAGHARPPHGGVGADAASRCRARVAGEGGAGGFRRLRAGFSK